MDGVGTTVADAAERFERGIANGPLAARRGVEEHLRRRAFHGDDRRVPSPCDLPVLPGMTIDPFPVRVPEDGYWARRTDGGILVVQFVPDPDTALPEGSKALERADRILQTTLDDRGLVAMVEDVDSHALADGRPAVAIPRPRARRTASRSSSTSSGCATRRSPGSPRRPSRSTTRRSRRRGAPPPAPWPTSDFGS